MLSAALAQGKPIMVIAITTAAITQPNAHQNAAKENPEQFEKEGDKGHRATAPDDAPSRRRWPSHSRNSRTFRRFARHNTSKASPTSGTAPKTPSSATLPSMRAMTW